MVAEKCHWNAFEMHSSQDEAARVSTVGVWIAACVFAPARRAAAAALASSLTISEAARCCVARGRNVMRARWRKQRPQRADGGGREGSSSGGSVLYYCCYLLAPNSRLTPPPSGQTTNPTNLLLKRRGDALDTTEPSHDREVHTTEWCRRECGREYAIEEVAVR